MKDPVPTNTEKSEVKKEEADHAKEDTAADAAAEEDAEKPKPSNANLFGDDDSSDDDEFDGNDGIVGKSADDGGAKNVVEEAKKPQTMNERLGEFCISCVLG